MYYNIIYLLIANLRLFFRGQSTLPWTYTTGAGSAAKDILDLDRETVLEIINEGGGVTPSRADLRFFKDINLKF